MFDLVNKYRTPVMWLCVVLMCGFGAWVLIADMFDADRAPEQEIGRFTVPGGKTISVTDRMWQRTLESGVIRRMLQPDPSGAERGDETPILAREIGFKTDDEVEAVWAFIVLRESAREAGVKATDASIIEEWNASIRRQAATNPGAAQQELTADEFKKRFPLEEDREFLRDLFAAKQFRNALNPPDETTYEKLFAKFKQDYEQLKPEYVFFDGAATPIVFDPKTDPQHRADLEKWWAEDAQRGVRAAKMIPEQGDFEVLNVSFKGLDEQAFDTLYETTLAPKIAAAGLTVTDADVEARFNQYRDAYKKAIDEGHAAETRRSLPTGSDFDAAKRRVQRELLTVKLFELVFKQLTTAAVVAPSFEQLKAEYGFSAGTVTRLDAEGILSQPEFGSAAAQSAILRGFADQTLKAGDILNYVDEGGKGPVDDPGKSVSIWRVLQRREAREPTLDDPGILDHATEKYLEKKRQDAAKSKADEFRKTFDERMTVALKEREAALDVEMTQAVAAELAAQNLSREKTEDRPKVLQVENAERLKRNEKLDALKAEQEPVLFKQLADELGYAIIDGGWMRRAVTRAAQMKPEDAKLPTAEKMARFFRKPQRMAAIGALKKGRVGQVEFEPMLAAAAVVRLVDRREPAPAELWALPDSLLARLRREVNPTPPAEWNYEALKSPTWFALDAPGLARAREERAKQKAAQAEKQRKDAETQKKIAQKKAAALIEQTRDRTSPIKSGDDW
jgi:hypothetical protein